jgi:Rha family phage regulatory protein
MTDLVMRSQKGTLVTTSLLVAEKFEKRHDHVMRDIRNMIECGSLMESPQNWGDLFYLTKYKDCQNKEFDMYVMTRDAFSLLVMGYSGEKALRFKLDYLNAFNQMESLMKNDDYIISRAMNIMQQKIESAKETIELQSHQLHLAAPKVEYYDDVLQAENTHTITTIAKELGLSGKALNQMLRIKNIHYFQDGHWVLYAKFQGNGYTKTRTHTFEAIEGGNIVKKSSILTVWTEKGREFIHGLIKEKIS